MEKWTLIGPKSKQNGYTANRSSSKKSPALNLMKTGPYALTTKVNCRYLLVPGQARQKNCAFLSGRRDFFPRPLGPGTSSSFPLIENRAAATDFGVSGTKVLAQICHTRLSPTSKLLFFVGAGGFEPPASWSRKLLHSRNAAILGQFSKFELHRVHRISQTVHNLLTLTGGPIATTFAGDPVSRASLVDQCSQTIEIARAFLIVTERRGTRARRVQGAN